MIVRVDLLTRTRLGKDRSTFNNLSKARNRGRGGEDVRIVAILSKRVRSLLGSKAL
jgi:hypothetical protein